MGHPSNFQLVFLRGMVFLSVLFLTGSTLAGATTPQAALTSALRETAATGVVVEVSSGRLLASVGARTARSTPGSLLKPLFLAAALEQRAVLPQTTVFCRRNLHVTDESREWNLPCTHPQNDAAFTAREALAYSCNLYFAELADRLSPAEAAAILARYGLPQPDTPLSREQKELLVLGVAHIQVSPLQMALAYRRLAQQLNRVPQASVLDPVREGLRDSVTYGMAHNADVPSVAILGKTGTANDTGWSHGWFAGIGDVDHEPVVLVIYLPRGNGGDAARLAQHFFLALPHAP